MKTLGLIGGISHHSTGVYYNLINKQVNEILGGNNAAKLLLYSVNYSDFKQLQTKNDWNGIENMLSDIAMNLENAGADCIMLCCNTAHLISGELKQKIKIPFIHIADETAIEIVKHKIKKVGLLGTRFTMENPFFIKCLSDAGIETIIPNTMERTLIHTVILDELSKGRLSHKSKEMFQIVMHNLKEQGAEAIILGCTEIGMFIKQSDCELQLFDTTTIHAKAAVDFALTYRVNADDSRNFKINSLGNISHLFRQKNIFTFQKAVDFVRQLPYGRNINKADLTTLFVEECGTCSSKHALLKQLAIEHDFNEAKLMVGLFRMNAVNTPGIKARLLQYKIEYIPEAHCYLKIYNEIIDATKSNSKSEDFVNDLIEEIEIVPHQIVHYKEAYHKKYLESWLKENNQIKFTLNELWMIREQCIQDIARTI
ncbi:MAG: aspartate/glutamate racemase family protein [Saprospiraceae bacterium]|nr:aspartate/glutamate racemase family protein [Saprospiraceae bacterium]